MAARLGAEAIRWPSATAAGRSFAVFVENLQPGSHAEIVKSFDLARDTLAAIQDGVPLPTLLPELSEFPLVVQLGASHRSTSKWLSFFNSARTHSPSD